MNSIDDIPREHLIKMLKEAAWSSADRSEFERQGFSLDVREETALRDVNYRHEPLCETREAAIIAQWQKHYQQTNAKHLFSPTKGVK